MEFLVKDLMITVFPSRPNVAGGCDAGATCACSGITPKCGGCSENPCTSCSSESKGVADFFTPVINPASPQALAALKSQLQEVLAAVEAKQKVQLESMRPQTAQEVEFLQRYMTAALEELQEAARDLEKKRNNKG